MTEQLPQPTIESERYELFEGPLYHFEVDRRHFFKIAGGGLVVCLFAGEVEAQRPRPAGPAELSAWLHISEEGKVTVYTGKVEVGQNARTSLTQVVADELRLPVAAVRLVMGDTDRTPYDAGTFGSGTSPRMAPQLRRAAAAARELLIDLAAEQW